MAPRRATLRTSRLVLEPVAPKHAEGLHAATVASGAAPLDWEPDGGFGIFPAESYDLELTSVHTRVK